MVHAIHPQDVTDTLKKDREGRGARKWRAAFRRIQQQLLDLEQDSKALELVYPQVRHPAPICFSWPIALCICPLCPVFTAYEYAAPEGKPLHPQTQAPHLQY